MICFDVCQVSTAGKISGVTAEYPTTIVLESTAHIFLQNEECAVIN